MSISVKCPHCGHEGKMAESSAGKTVRCPGCGKRFRAEGDHEYRPNRATRWIIIGIIALFAIFVGATFLASMRLSANNMEKFQNRINKM